MNKFKIVRVCTGIEKVFVEVENINSKKREFVVLEAYNFYTAEMKLIKEKIEEKCPNNLYFELPDLNLYNSHKKICRAIRNYIEN